MSVFVVGALAAGVLASRPSVSVAQTTSPPAAKPPAAKSPGAAPKVQEAAVVTARGTVEAVDKEKQTVTIKGPQRTLTLHVRDPKKLDVIKVGDPVVAKYYEAVAYSVKKPGTATPGVTAQQETATSKPGQTPAGGVAQQITLTVTVVAIDKAAQTVTVKGPEGRTETVKARDPKNLDLLNVGDLVEITYTRAFAVALDKSPAK